MNIELIGKLREQINNQLKELKRLTFSNPVVDYCTADHLLDVTYKPIIKIVDIQDTSSIRDEEIDFLANEWNKYYIEYYNLKLELLNSISEAVSTANDENLTISYQNQITRLKRLILILSPKYNIVEFGEKNDNKQLLEGYWINDEGKQYIMVNRLLIFNFTTIEKEIVESFKKLGFEISHDNKEVDIIIRKKGVVFGVEVKIIKEQFIDYLLFQDLTQKYRDIYTDTQNQ